MRLRLLIPVALLPLVLACTGAGTGDGSDGSLVTIGIQGQYQGVDPTTGTTSMKPIRYGYAELVDAGSNQTFASGYLGPTGAASGGVEPGRSFYVRISASVEVPNGAGTVVVLRGSVKNAARPASFANAAAFDAIPDVSVTSSTQTPGNGGTLVLTATPDAQQRAASFNAADQMVTYALGVSTLESTLKLPNLHAFWTTSAEITDTPVAEIMTGGGVLQKGGRAVFTLQVAGDNSAAAFANDDLNDDGVLLQAYAHQLFGDRSYPETGVVTPGQPSTIVRRDNDNGTNDRDVQSEPTLAFQAGFCDFLSSAFRRLNGDANPQLIQDSFNNGAGAPVYSSFDLTSHGQFSRVAGQGEFYRGSVAISLWNIWNTALSGTTPNLQTLWLATTNASAGAYLNAPLGCYPTYLVGLRTALGSGSVAWSDSLFQLGLEDVPNPDASYFAGTALWSTQSTPFAGSGSFPTYVSGVSFDRNQAQSYRFVQGATGPRTITLSTTSPGLVLDLIDSVGLYDQRLATSGGDGVISYSLPAGTYVVRVRVDPFTAYANGTANWSLTIN
jgi:hypothetical protein